MAPGVVVEEEGNQQQEDAPPPPRPPLAVEALRDKIVEKVKANRVTLIVGDTGCGNCRGFPSPITFSIGSTVCGCCDEAFLRFWGFVEARRWIFFSYDFT
jgi:hypothetical protein